MDLWWIITIANPDIIRRDSFNLKPGLQIRIPDPNRVSNILRSFEQLNKYIIEHIYLNYNISLVNQDTWSNMYLPNERTEPLLNVDPVDLKNSPDYTLLYGVGTSDCHVRIYYDDNRRKGRSWDMKLENNGFILFPSNNIYYIDNKPRDTLNFVQTITYIYV